jgi:hypothetical protein
MAFNPALASMIQQITTGGTESQYAKGQPHYSHAETMQTSSNFYADSIDSPPSNVT